jgi:hypothetical protein
MAFGYGMAAVLIAWFLPWGISKVVSILKEAIKM